MYTSQVKERRRKSRKVLQTYCIGNVKKFLQETTLHGLKFVGDSSITIWERSFFLCSFLAAFVTTVNLISNIYVKWDSTPVIIGISPHPTSILKIPFPAISVCNMNQALLSKVSNYSEDSYESALLKLLCFTESEFDENLRDSPNFKNNNLKIADFVVDHAQPCSKMLLSCELSFLIHNCTDLFREVMTNEGLCCVFNVLHSDFLYKGNYRQIKDLNTNDGSVAVNWNIETGYPPHLPESYYPRPASGTGVSMGLSLILNAELDEYFCSTTNGPGFKVALHNPIETPDVKETGLTVPIGFETRFRIDAQRSEAVPNLRSIQRNARQCLFNNEDQLLFYKYYTRRNCEMECQAKYLLQSCQCIPYNLPLIFANASICSAKESFCITKAEKGWMRDSDHSCRNRCLPSCFDLSFLPDSFSAPLAERNYSIPSDLLRKMPKEYLSKNIAIIHFYYRETVFYGDLKNVYIGLTEFLSNTGGILGLFMGFSFISVAEIFYFTILRPIFELIVPQRNLKRLDKTQLTEKETHSVWLGEELHKSIRQQSNSKTLSTGHNSNLIKKISKQLIHKRICQKNT